MATMEVDPPHLSGSQPDIASSALPPLNPLKRSNSAPMINVLPADTPVVSSSSSAIIVSGSGVSSGQQPLPVSTSANSYPHMPSPTFCHTFQRQYERIRRYSTSSTCLHSSTTPVKVPPQLDRIKREESSNPKEREAAHEHKIQSQAQLSLSWESLHLADDLNTAGGEPKRPKSFGEPLHIFTSPFPPYAASSPSPTRIGKQCFSPSLQQPVRTLAGSLTPSPSPSPTRKSFHRRSMSPIALRPSPLGASLKRKMEADSDHRMDCYSSPKRHQMTYSPITATSTFSHPLMHSSSSSGEDCQQQNGMLPPSPLQLPDSTPNVFVSSSQSFTCRSPLVFVSSPAVSTSSSPSVVSLADMGARSHSPQPMDEQQQPPQPQQHQQQHNEAFRNAFHGIFPATTISTTVTATVPMANHISFHHHHQQQQQHHHQQHHHHQQQQQQQTYTNNHCSSTNHLNNHHRASGFSVTAASTIVTSDVVMPRVVHLSSGTPPPAAASLFGTFRPVVRDSVDSAMSTGGTDSETSDMAETTDLSETSDANNSLEAGPNHPMFNLPPVSKANVQS